LKVIFLSSMFSDIEADIALSKSNNSVSGHKFQENLIRGIAENGCDLSVINKSRVRTYPNYPKIIMRKKKRLWLDALTITEPGFLNLSLFSYLTYWAGCYAALRRELKKAKKEPCVLVTFNSNLHNCFPMLLARRLHKNVTLCNIVGDLHGVYGLQNRAPGLKGLLIRLAERMQDPVGRKLDSFVFLTEFMAEAMGVAHKPSCVVEGLYPMEEQQITDCEENENAKIVFYAGTMCKEYGLEHLLRAFSLIEDESYQLWLAGDGDTAELIEECASRDNRIKYLGYITPQQVARRQAMATVLISPRTSEQEFVKYSFASKTMECLASGKPYIAHKLPCDPPEYARHIQYAADDSDEALRDKIIEICQLPKEKREKLGADAKNFIATEKNPKAMCQRIVALWESILKSK